MSHWKSFVLFLFVGILWEGFLDRTSPPIADLYAAAFFRSESKSSGHSPDPDTRVILFFGDSLTAGYGVDPEQAFPALIQQKIDALHWPFRVINAGVSGETTAAGLRRIDWILQRKIDLMVLELGANDGLRGIPLETTKGNLKAIIEHTKTKYPEAQIVLAGMQLPPNLGADYTAQFRSLYPELAKEYNLPLIPFLLEGVGGVPALNLPDGIHPTPEGHNIIAENVWEVVKPLLESWL